MEEIYVHKDGQQLGPLPAAEVLARLGRGEFHAEDLIWQPGWAEWRPLRTLAASSNTPAPAAEIPRSTTPLDRTQLYYQPSGHIPVPGLVLIFALGAVVALVGGILYGVLVYFIPFVILRVALCMGFAYVLGIALAFAAKRGKVRSVRSMALFGLICGCTALYVSWSTWIYLISSPHALLLMPWSILGAIFLIAKEGAWSFKRAAVSGIPLLLIWLAEALIVTIGAAYVVRKVARATPFCEQCQRWVEISKIIAPLEAVRFPDELVHQLELGNFAPLTMLPKYATGMAVYTQVEISQCLSCKSASFLTVRGIEICADNEGNQSKKEKEIIHLMIITPEWFEKLGRHWSAASGNVVLS